MGFDFLLAIEYVALVVEDEFRQARGISNFPKSVVVDLGFPKQEQFPSVARVFVLEVDSQTKVGKHAVVHADSRTVVHANRGGLVASDVGLIV